MQLQALVVVVVVVEEVEVVEDDVVVVVGGFGINSPTMKAKSNSLQHPFLPE